MEMRTCKVTIRGEEGVEHTVQVTAATLFEAVAMALRTFHNTEWVENAGRSADIHVTVQQPAVTHVVKSGEFYKWLGQNGNSPREMVKRQRVRELLGIPDPRRMG